MAHKLSESDLVVLHDPDTNSYLATNERSINWGELADSVEMVGIITDGEVSPSRQHVDRLIEKHMGELLSP